MQAKRAEGYTEHHRPDKTRLNWTEPDQTRQNQTEPNQTRLNWTRPNQTEPNQTRQNQTRQNQTEPDQTAPNKTKSDGTAASSPSKRSPETEPDGTGRTMIRFGEGRHGRRRVHDRESSVR